MTQYDKILKVLKSGKQLSIQRAKKMGIVNPYARVAELRESGVNIMQAQDKSGHICYQLGR